MVIGGSWWFLLFLVVLGYSWQFFVVLGNYWGFLFDFVGSGWFLVVLGGS